MTSKTAKSVDGISISDSFFQQPLRLVDVIKRSIGLHEHGCCLFIVHGQLRGIEVKTDSITNVTGHLEK